MIGNGLAVGSKLVVLAGFWVVTIDRSIYRVLNQLQDDGHTPLVLKIKGKRSTPKMNIGWTLKDGGLVAISRASGIFLYDPVNRAPLEETNTVYWGGRTSAIVGLFATQSKAEACLAQAELMPWDERWLTSSAEIIRHIGPDHPLFILSHGLPTIKQLDGMPSI